MATHPREGAAKGTRLDSWKEIATFFGRDARTVKRWESERALPIHRVPGGERGGVFAYVHELETWLNATQKKSAPTLLPSTLGQQSTAPERINLAANDRSSSSKIAGSPSVKDADDDSGFYGHVSHSSRRSRPL